MDKIEKIANELKKYTSEIYLFGSRARGDNLKNSDIDIAINVNLSFREKRKLKDKIEKLAGIYSVDLVFLDEINNDLKRKILKEGKKL
ncbi:nucleotidyltransferase domain-containing protein [Caminibacter mediatlanticus TB-2]|uniref:Nucleotidyltransferase domain-containing protein n=1 Tax=Caminibacter mediatlanticus TB-2 TaxID=391592 RepID=A0AAI9AH95_9BACT|nr:nucleotidyltransferase domain-containing protein [Caminibacter mediatlanticus]EDM23482.1 hypothetical protein CMTB2_08102 [Caminibacter mediatlanticus TB-2]QCT94052.1 nucleotidyltransferase domain-containing protein [Caminibacter mediatlanticus TB-2]